MDVVYNIAFKNTCWPKMFVLKYGVNRVTLVGNVGDEPRVSEKEGEAFVANFPLATNEFYRNKEGEEDSKTEWHQIVYMSGTFFSSNAIKECWFESSEIQEF